MFGIVESVAQIKESMDVEWVKTLSSWDLICSSDSVHIEGQLNNLSSETSKLRFKQQDILKEKSISIKC